MHLLLLDRRVQNLRLEEPAHHQHGEGLRVVRRERRQVLVDLELQHSNFWVNYDGRVWWTRTARLTLRCDMCFEFMPYDTQQCFMVFTSFTEGADEVSLHFGRPPGAGSWLARRPPAPAARVVLARACYQRAQQNRAAY